MASVMKPTKREHGQDASTPSEAEELEIFSCSFYHQNQTGPDPFSLKQVSAVAKELQISMSGITLDLELMPQHPIHLHKKGSPAAFHVHQRTDHTRFMAWLHKMFVAFGEQAPLVISSFHVRTVDGQTVPIRSLVRTASMLAKRECSSSLPDHLGIAWGTISSIEERDEVYALQVSDFSNRNQRSFQILLSRYYYDWRTARELMDQRIVCFGYFSVSDQGIPTVSVVSLPHQLASCDETGHTNKPLPQIQLPFLQKRFLTWTNQQSWMRVGPGFYRPYYAIKRTQYEQAIFPEREAKRKELRVLEHQIQTLKAELKKKQAQYQAWSRKIYQMERQSIHLWHQIQILFFRFGFKTRTMVRYHQLIKQKQRCAHIIQTMSKKRQELTEQAMKIRHWLEQDGFTIQQLEKQSRWEKSLKVDSAHKLVHACPLGGNRLMVIETAFREREGQIELSGKLRPYLLDDSYYIPLGDTVHRVRLVTPIHQWEKQIPLYWEQVKFLIHQNEKKAIPHAKSSIG